MEHRPQCSACKRMSRECATGCELAQLSSYDAPLLSQVFGFSKVEKTLKQFDCPEKKKEAMKNMILESRLRAADPAVGSGGVIARMSGRIRDLERQLEHNREQLILFLYHHHCVARFQHFQSNLRYGYPIPVHAHPAAAALQPPLPLQNPNVWGHQQQNPNVLSIHDYDVHSEVDSNGL